MGVKPKTEIIVENIKRKLKDKTGKTTTNVLQFFLLDVFVEQQVLTKPTDANKFEIYDYVWPSLVSYRTDLIILLFIRFCSRSVDWFNP